MTGAFGYIEGILYLSAPLGFSYEICLCASGKKKDLFQNFFIHQKVKNVLKNN